MQFTHAFINVAQRLVPLEDFAKLQSSDPDLAATARAFGFRLVNGDTRYDKNGNPSRKNRGWAWGHIQNGHICAGAGGVSKRVLPLGDKM